MRRLIVNIEQRSSSASWLFKNIIVISLITAFFVNICEHQNEAIEIIIICVEFLSDLLENINLSFKHFINIDNYLNTEECNEKFNVNFLIAAIKEEIYGQNDAIVKIQKILNKQMNFTAIAITGSSGVGKTFFATEFHKTFQWKNNAKHIFEKILTTYNSESKFAKKLTRDLSSCGYNLLIIDNLTSKDLNYIKRLTEEVEKMLNLSSYKLILIYIVNFNRFDEDFGSYKIDMMKMSKFKNINVINFREFNEKDVEVCVRNHMQKLNANLDKSAFEEIVRLIDAHNTGCKKVRSKVEQYIYSNNILAYH